MLENRKETWSGVTCQRQSLEDTRANDSFVIKAPRVLG